MKILFISAANSTHTIKWVNSLSEQGHEVHLAFNKNHAPINEMISNYVIIHKLFFGGSISYFLNSLQLKYLFHKIKPNVVNAHYASGYGTLSRLAKVKPLVLSVWGSDVYDFPYKSKFNMRLIRNNLKYANKIASTSESMAQQVHKLVDLKNEIAITPFGVDIDKFKPITVQKNDSEFTFGIVKTLEDKYGIDYLIKAFALFCEHLENNNDTTSAKLVIFGKGSKEMELKELANALNVNDKIIFKGFVENGLLPSEINKFDVFCLGSISESFGVAAVEAMACGKPIIATDASGFKEIVVDGVTGFLVERKNEVAMAEKMKILFNDAELRQSMGVQGRKRVLEKYFFKNNVMQMINIYEEIGKPNC